MGPSDQLCAVLGIEYFHSVLPEYVARSSRGHSPAFDLLRIRPHEITHWSLVGHLLLSVYGLDLVEGVDVRREASVNAKYLLVDQSSQGQEIEYFSAVAPHVDRAVLAQTLIVKAVDLRDLPALVVASDQRDVLGVPHFESQQQQERLDRVEAPVHEVPHEEVVGSRTVVAHFEQLHQVVELPVDVAADGDGSVDRLDVGLFNQNVFRIVAQVSDFAFLYELALF